MEHVVNKHILKNPQTHTQ